MSWAQKVDANMAICNVHCNALMDDFYEGTGCHYFLHIAPQFHSQHVRHDAFVSNRY